MPYKWNITLGIRAAAAGDGSGSKLKCTFVCYPLAVINNHCQLGAGECRVAIFPRTGSAGPVVPDVSNDSLNMELRYQIVYVLK